jgi:hypothetical protein
MSASPAATPVTAPLALTVAAAVFDEDQLAVLVTGTVVPSDNVAVAENCAVVPTWGADPDTPTETTVAFGAGVDVLAGEGDVEGLLEQASRSQPVVTRARRTAPRRACRVSGVTPEAYARCAGATGPFLLSGN